MAFDIKNYQLFLRTKTRSVGAPQRSINSSSQDEILQLWRISGAAITPGRASVVMTEPVDPQPAFLPIMIASNHVQCKWAESSVGLRSPTVLRLVYFWTLWTISRGSCPAHVGPLPPAPLLLNRNKWDWLGMFPWQPGSVESCKSLRTHFQVLSSAFILNVS